ncbi:carboxyl-terminal processing protease [Pseudomonas kuykendallii]|uniref:Carboxyl-terminal processing protease n=1 Tax=Pseudomonas kuykendallii TaxID=1007099 RepID=A0A2W5CV90_9PSED|nr:S41 family peptidase [Pseudomonas kuykendallii]PZP23201.1 MAG: S41 family peptidase [Pseudomonas kuykendallii]SDW67784.1 carboxyl-terminal processing protease [Pseudomonas kuykendallii]
MLHVRHLLRPTSLALALSLIAGSGGAWAQQPPASMAPAPMPATPAAQAKAPLPLDELRTFAEVLDRIKAAYVEPVDDKTLLENAIKGMLSNLDPHSAYLDPQEFEELQESTSGEFGGLGIEVGVEDGFIKVVSPIDDTPASKAGIEAGDLIVKIDGQPTKGLSMMDAVDKMRGKPGSKISLTLVRGEGGKPFDVELARAVIKVQSVKSQFLEKGFGYVRITQFQINTGEEVGKALAKLRKDNNGKLKGLVLDLRNNPGGVLQSAVEVADHFLTDGLIVYTKGRIANSELRFSADPADASEGVPLVVLINGGSASAAEIVAGALQDHKRGVLMGTDSFGKGSVQTVLPLNNDRALKLTTALYFTPNGRSIQAQGIVPDIEVARAKVTPEGDGETFKEADLAGHLGNGNGGADKPSGHPSKTEPRLQDDDYQLNQALNLLKGLNLTRSK